MALIIKKNRLRDIRNQKSLSAYDLQLLSFIPAQILYMIERGLKIPHSYEKERISKALNVPVDDIFPKEMERNQKIERILRYSKMNHEGFLNES
jgi:transcriptional regulator with XRE-family HTH domain